MIRITSSSSTLFIFFFLAFLDFILSTILDHPRFILLAETSERQTWAGHELGLDLFNNRRWRLKLNPRLGAGRENWLNGNQAVRVRTNLMPKQYLLLYKDVYGVIRKSKTLEEEQYPRDS